MLDCILNGLLTVGVAVVAVYVAILIGALLWASSRSCGEADGLCPSSRGVRILTPL
jgi:hypothetical protein